jgi:DNA-binding CsgD family transcriptional regulator
LYWYRGAALEADRASEQAITVLEGIPPSAQRAMAYSLRSQLCMLNDHMEQAVVWGNRALALEKQFTDIKVRIHALNNVGTALVFRGISDGLAMLQDSLSLAKEHDEHEEAARTYVNLSEYALEFRQFELAEKTINEGIIYDTEHDIDAWTHYMLGRLAQLRLEQGRLLDACTIAKGIVDNTKLTLLMRLPALQVLARAHMRLNTEGASKFMQAALKDALTTDELQNIVPARLTLIEAAWLSADYPTGQMHLDILLALDDGDRHPWNIGERSIWQQRYAMAQGIKTQILNQNITLPLPYALEISGDHLGAAKHWQHCGLPHAAALSLLAANNQNHMLECATIFTSIGAQAGLKCLTLRAKQQNWDMSQISVRGRYNTKASQHPLGLTQKEQQVLALLAKGINNKDISLTLSRSTRTIEHHVTSILTKLNAPNRMAVMLRIQNEPWLLAE